MTTTLQALTCPVWCEAHPPAGPTWDAYGVSICSVEAGHVECLDGPATRWRC